LGKNFYKGILGDAINVMLAASAWNFKRMINKWKENPLIEIYVQLKILIFELTFRKNEQKWAM
jgi:transposase, IS5 family